MAEKHPVFVTADPDILRKRARDLRAAAHTIASSFDWHNTQEGSPYWHHCALNLAELAEAAERAASRIKQESGEQDT